MEDRWRMGHSGGASFQDSGELPPGLDHRSRVFLGVIGGISINTNTNESPAAIFLRVIDLANIHATGIAIDVLYVSQFQYRKHLGVSTPRVQLARFQGGIQIRTY